MKNYKTKRTKLFSRNNMRYDWKQIHEKLNQIYYERGNM